MDAGSGHIYEANMIQRKDIKGKLVTWQVGEEIIIRNCKFKIDEIHTFPADKIVLRGMPNPIFSNEFKKAERESSHKIIDYVRKKGRGRE